MIEQYDLRLVALSYLVAVFASYTALDLAGRVTSANGRARIIWLLGGASSMGIGIWSMHFTGMLAFMLPMPVHYDFPVVFASLVIAIIASGAALFVMSRPTPRTTHLLVGGPIVGAGIAGMHYTGMAAMQMDASVHYNSPLVALSLVIAVAASVAALWLAFQFRGDQALSRRGIRLKRASALVMGLAITGMHYTGMAAATFTSNHAAMSHTTDVNVLPLAIAIACGTLVILGFTLLASLFDRRFALQATALVESAERYQSLFQYHSDAVLTYDLEGTLRDANQAATRLFGRTLSELQRHGVRALLGPEEANQLESYLCGAAQGEHQTFDLAFTPDQGCSLLFHVRTIPIKSAGRIVGIYLIATDMSERARTLETLLRSESELRALLDHQQVLFQTIHDLSTPILPVHEGVLLLPLIGQIEAERGRQISPVLLTAIEQHRAHAVIIDVTGVPILDTIVASHLLELTQAARLLGAETVLVGVTPEVAQTIVQLGVNVSALTTRSNVQSGIAYAVSRRKQIHTRVAAQAV